MRSRIFLVGTDTEVGKTSLACALVRAGEAAGLRVLPFKPAASGPSGPGGDPERLVAACSLGLSPEQICPLRFPQPLAPGVAEDPAPFLAGAPLVFSGVQDMSEVPRVLRQVQRAIAEIEAETRPDLTLIEGAGGLWVPMPGGTWLPRWIRELEAVPVVVGRLGLGTVNHTLLTLAGLRQLGLVPRGFFLVDRVGGEDPSRSHNAAIVAAASGTRCLGVMPFAAADPGWVAATVWPELLARTGR